LLAWISSEAEFPAAFGVYASDAQPFIESKDIEVRGAPRRKERCRWGTFLLVSSIRSQSITSPSAPFPTSSSEFGSSEFDERT
jgi:hypothetical protein